MIECSRAPADARPATIAQRARYAARNADCSPRARRLPLLLACSLVGRAVGSVTMQFKLNARKPLAVGKGARARRAVTARAAATEAPVASAETVDTCINAIRFLSIDAVNKANSGHPGAPMGCAPMSYVLWNEAMKYNPKNPKFSNRDRFVLSIGHASMLQYSMMHLCGFDSVSVRPELRPCCPGAPAGGPVPCVVWSGGPRVRRARALTAAPGVDSPARPAPDRSGPRPTRERARADGRHQELPSAALEDAGPPRELRHGRH